MTEKLVRRGLNIPPEYEADVFQQVRVGEVMEQKLVTLPCEMRLTELVERIARSDPALALHQAFPIVDEAGRLRGIITRGDVLRALEQEPADEALSVLEAGSDEPIVAYPDELVHEAVIKMLKNDVGRLPVVARGQPDHLVGYLTRARILSARLQRIQDESLREPGWIARLPVK